jgi:hypothetical protein
VALGGELTAGPTASGWRVSCRLPSETLDQLPRATDALDATGASRGLPA